MWTESRPCVFVGFRRDQIPDSYRVGNWEPTMLTFVLEIIRAVLPRRGGKGRDDRRFQSPIRATMPKPTATWPAIGASCQSFRTGRTPRRYTRKYEEIARTTRSGRAIDGQDETVEAHRLARRENQAELRLVRSVGLWIYLDQIRPHGLLRTCPTDDVQIAPHRHVGRECAMRQWFCRLV